MGMHVEVKGEHIGSIYNAESMSLIVQPQKELDMLNDAERRKLVADLRMLLEQQTAALPPPERDAIRSVAEQAVTPSQDAQKRESNLLAFMKTLKDTFGDAADIVLTAVKLTKVLTGI